MKEEKIIMPRPELIKVYTLIDCKKAKELIADKMQVAEGRRDLEAVKDLRAVREKVHRRQKKLESYQGRNATPKEVISAEILNALIRGAPEFIDQHNGDGSEITLSEKTVKNFSKPETKYLLDAILYFMDDYALNGGPYVTKGEDRYFITLEFKELLKKTGAAGETRKKIKQLVIDALEDRGQPLQYLTFEKKSERKILTTTFVTIEKALRQETGTPLRRGQRVERIQLSVSGSVYQWLERYAADIRGDMPLFRGHLGKMGSMGYLPTPRLLQRKIDDGVKKVIAFRDTGGEAFFQYIPVKPEAIDQLERRPSTSWREAIEYLENRWETGKENRKTPMEVSWGELRREGLLSEHRNNKEKRGLDLVCVGLLCEELRINKEILSGCRGVLLGPEAQKEKGTAMKLMFPLKEDAPRTLKNRD